MSDPRIECPACGASLASNLTQTTCPACGSPVLSLSGSAAPMNPARLAKVQDQVTALDKKLFEAGANNAESAFNLGCGMSALLVIGSTTIVYFLTGQNWIFAGVAVIMASLTALWAIVLISDIARNSALRRTYQQSIGPEMDNLAAAQQIELTKIHEVAYDSLPENAPLRKFIPPSPEPEEEALEE